MKLPIFSTIVASLGLSFSQAQALNRIEIPNIMKIIKLNQKTGKDVEIRSNTIHELVELNNSICASRPLKFSADAFVFTKNGLKVLSQAESSLSSRSIGLARYFPQLGLTTFQVNHELGTAIFTVTTDGKLESTHVTSKISGLDKFVGSPEGEYKCLGSNAAFEPQKLNSSNLENTEAVVFAKHSAAVMKQMALADSDSIVCEEQSTGRASEVSSTMPIVELLDSATDEAPGSLNRLIFNSPRVHLNLGQSKDRLPLSTARIFADNGRKIVDLTYNQSRTSLVRWSMTKLGSETINVSADIAQPKYQERSYVDSKIDCWVKTR